MHSKLSRRPPAVQLEFGRLILSVVLGVLAVGSGACSRREERGEIPKLQVAGPASLHNPLEIEKPHASLRLPTLHACRPELPSPERIRLLSWNIKAGRVLGFASILDELEKFNADVVLLQEVDVGVRRSGRLDQPREIERRMNYEHAFASTRQLQGGIYGLALFSRLPFNTVERVSLTNRHAQEARSALDAKLCIGTKQLRVINHHADYIARAAAVSVTELLGRLEQEPEALRIFAGDLNQSWQELAGLLPQSGLSDVFALEQSRAKRIDFVLLDDTTARAVIDRRIIATEASDHPALLIEFTPNPAQ